VSPPPYISFTIEIAEEDRPRRSRANRPLSSGRTVSPITKRVVLIPRPL